MQERLLWHILSLMSFLTRTLCVLVVHLVSTDSLCPVEAKELAGDSNFQLFISR